MYSTKQTISSYLRKIMKGHCLLFLVIWFAACSHTDPLLEHALTQAGANRKELEKVLDSYRDTDEEKYRAARFLIRNMPFYHSYEGKALDKYLQYYKSFSAGDRGAQVVIDSLKQADGAFTMASLTKRKDPVTIDSAFLTAHIDWAFKVRREQPWGKNVSFQDFCEYILPYRIGDEPLSLWRKELYEQYNPLLDSLRATPGADDPLQAAKIILNHLRKEGYKYTGQFPDGPHVGPEILQWKVGNCRDFADGLTYACRALGIPCGTDRVFVRGDCNSSHTWNFTLDKDGHSYAVDFQGRGEPWRPCDQYPMKRKGKVIRTTYSLNETLMEQGGKAHDIHPTFKYPFFRDVTEMYVDSIRPHDVKIPFHKLYRTPERGEAVYLCMTNKLRWMPVDYTYYKGGDIRFEHVEEGVTCIAGTWSGHEIVPLCDPFLIKEPARLHFYTPEASEQAVPLYMKFHMAVYDTTHIRMLQGTIEGSDRSDFRQTDTLYLITRKPYRRYTAVRLNTRKPYRYMRYRGGPNSWCHVAEVAFYAQANDTIPLRGRAIGQTEGNGKLAEVFDGNTETSLLSTRKSGSWAGLDFGKPMELFYWGDGRWKSLGRQTATSDSLLYRAPVNALLYLRCYTAGDEERIFEYKDGEQIFR